jgi:hypothetical protein
MCRFETYHPFRESVEKNIDSFAKILCSANAEAMFSSLEVVVI